MIRGWIHKGFKACFLVSSSVDGDVPARIARAWGAEVIRGSANQTGTLVLRDMRNVLQRGVSIVTTADGPMGPKHEFKAGAALMARISSVPMVPLAAAADRAWYLDRWDDFMIPKPFARVVLGVGVGKWVNNLGGVGTALAASALIGLALLVSRTQGTHLSAADFRVADADWRLISSFGVICFALVGLELGSVMGDEVRDPERTIPSAVAWGGVEEPVEVIRSALDERDGIRVRRFRLRLADGTVLDVSRDLPDGDWRIDREVV